MSIQADGKTCEIVGFLVWDGITKPEANDSGQIAHSCKIVFNPQQPDANDVLTLANAELTNGEFKGQLPVNGRFAVAQVAAGEFGGNFDGWYCLNARTYNGAPQVFDMQGNTLNPMTYNPMLYTGSQVELLVHFYSYNNKSKGIAVGLDGLRIVNAEAPRLQLGAGFNAASVWGNGQQAQLAAPAPAGLPPAQVAAPAGLPPAQVAQPMPPAQVAQPMAPAQVAQPMAPIPNGAPVVAGQQPQAAAPLAAPIQAVPVAPIAGAVVGNPAPVAGQPLQQAPAAYLQPQQ